jgi:hypothetical protein
MSLYRKPGERASEAVTFRLTLNEKRLLDHLAFRAETTLTDLFRDLLAQRAREIEVDTLPPEPVRRRPGRPRKTPIATKTVVPATPLAPLSVLADDVNTSMSTFGEIVEGFRGHFSGRAEGTRKELDETIRYLGDNTILAALLPGNMPLVDLTSTKLALVRDAMKNMEMRFSMRNLHLTYLRMMLQWAIRQPDVTLDIDPKTDLESFSIKEISNAWPGPSK